MILFLSIATVINTKANDSLLVSYLLQRIDTLQCKVNGVFPKGMFPSYRTYALNTQREKADPNIFYTGLIGFTLREIYSELPLNYQQKVTKILENSIPVYPLFQNTKGRHTYNFWYTNPPKILPNSGWLNLFDKYMSLPDDMDCTAINMLALNVPDTIAKQVHNLMQSFTNNGNKKTIGMLAQQGNLGAYDTWFGKKYPVEIDICVLANILCFTQHYNIPWTKADSLSLSLIENVIAQKQHITQPIDVSPYYSRTPKILYHLARLMSVKPISSLERYKGQFIEEAKSLLLGTNNFMDQIILQTALLKWGVNMSNINIIKTNSLTELIETDTFSFFNGDWANKFKDPFKKWMRFSKFSKFNWECEAYNNVLVLEYLIWKNKIKRSL